MNKSKKFTGWRVVGIVVLCLVVLSGFAGSYMLGLRSGSLMDGDTVWSHPMDRVLDKDGDFYDGYGSNFPMGMYGRYGRMHHGMGFSFFGRFFGGLLFLAFIGALIRLVFFPMSWRRHSIMGRMHAHHSPHFHHGPYSDHSGSGKCECNCDCDCEDEKESDDVQELDLEQ